MASVTQYKWSAPSGLIDGTGNLTAMGGANTLNIPAVDVQKTAQGDGTFSFTDNRGHTLVGIERIYTSNNGDNLDLAYSLADSANWLSGYVIEIRTFGGADTVRIADSLPADYGSSPGPGALVVGGAGNDVITGGKENDFLYGDTDELVGVTGNDTIRGGAGNDEIYGDDGNDKLFGGSGDDRLTGDLGMVVKGRDQFTGGSGADFIILGSDGKGDTVFYTAAGDSTKAHADEVVGFEFAHDVLDFSAIDANRASKGNQAFDLVRNLSGQAGELQAKIIDIGYDYNVKLSGDTNGDGNVDFYLTAEIEANKLTFATLGDCLVL